MSASGGISRGVEVQAIDTYRPALREALLSGRNIATTEDVAYADSSSIVPGGVESLPDS
jgi:transcription initiation factor TFIIIB Brf1 subunit/transcription initiation factor TFIIB